MSYFLEGNLYQIIGSITVISGLIVTYLYNKKLAK